MIPAHHVVTTLCGQEWHGDVWNDGTQPYTEGVVFNHDCGLGEGHGGPHRCRACGLTPERSWRQ